jgi:hypothetical protein
MGLSDFPLVVFLKSQPSDFAAGWMNIPDKVVSCPAMNPMDWTAGNMLASQILIFSKKLNLPHPPHSLNAFQTPDGLTHFHIRLSYFFNHTTPPMPAALLLVRMAQHLNLDLVPLEGIAHLSYLDWGAQESTLSTLWENIQLGRRLGLELPAGQAPTRMTRL